MHRKIHEENTIVIALVISGRWDERGFNFQHCIVPKIFKFLILACIDFSNKFSNN